MGSLLALLLPLAVGAAISPLPTAACLVLLSTNRRPLATSVAFLVGSGAAFVAVGLLMLYAFGGVGFDAGGRTDEIKNSIDVLIGVFLLALACKLWLKAPNRSVGPPGWLAGVGSAGVLGSFLLGSVMSATNFSSMPLFLSGLKEIVTADIGLGARSAVLAVFVLLMEAGLLVPIGFYVVSPRRAAVVLGDALRWIEKRDRAVNICVLLLFGLLLLAKGVAGLWGGA